MANHISCVFCVGQALSLSDTEHGWAHSSNAVYLVIHRLTGTSIELQPCIGMSWYDLNSNVARVCTNKAQIYSIKKDLSRFEHDSQNDFHRIVVYSKYVKYGLLRPSTIKHDFYSINWTFTGFTYGPTDFCSSSITYDLYTILTRLSSLVEWTSCAVVYTVLHGFSKFFYGLTLSLTFMHDR